jgi:hypothetical protein
MARKNTGRAAAAVLALVSGLAWAGYGDDRAYRAPSPQSPN